MKLRDAWLAVMLSVLAVTPALAGPSPKIREMVKKLSASIPAPAEWQGVWSEADSAYTCDPLTFSDFSTELDTVCAGQQVVPPGSSSSPIPFDCAGSADANSIHLTCTANGFLGPDCSVYVTLQVEATRTNDTFYSVNRVTTQYLGPGCGGFPDQCTEDHIHATRISAATAYCATPTEPSTWGKVKAAYR